MLLMNCVVADAGPLIALAKLELLAVLDGAYRDLFGAQSRRAWLSDETLLKQLINRSAQESA